MDANLVATGGTIPKTKRQCGEFWGLVSFTLRENSKLLFFSTLVISLIMTVFGSDYLLPLDDQMGHFFYSLSFSLLYTLLLSSQTFAGDTGTRSPRLTSRFGAGHWKLFFARSLVFVTFAILPGMVFCIIFFIAHHFQFGEFMEILKSIPLWSLFFAEGETLLINYHYYSGLSDNHGMNGFDLVEQARLFMETFFLLRFYLKDVAIGLFCSVLFRRRLPALFLSFVIGFGVITYFNTQFPTHEGIWGLFYDVFSISLLILTVRHLKERLATNEIRLFRPMNLLILLGPIILLGIFYPQLYLWCQPKEKAIFQPDTAVLSTPYCPDMGEDKKSIQLENELGIALTHRLNPNTGIVPVSTMFLHLPANASLDFVNYSGHYQKDSAELFRLNLSEAREIWNVYREVYRKSPVAFGNWSFNIENVIYQGLLHRVSELNLQELEQSIAFLQTIPETRPDVVEQSRRLYQFLRRLAAVRDVRNVYPYPRGLYFDNRYDEKLFSAHLWNEMQLTAKMLRFCSDRFYHSTNEKADGEMVKQNLMTFIQLKARYNFWFGVTSKDYKFNYSDTLIVNPLPEAEAKVVLATENCRRLLIVRMALELFEREKKRIPNDLEELVDAKYLKEIPGSCFSGCPIQYSKRIPQQDKEKYRLVIALIKSEDAACGQLWTSNKAELFDQIPVYTSQEKDQWRFFSNFVNMEKEEHTFLYDDDTRLGLIIK